MKSFIVYNNEGKILRTGICQDSTFSKQAGKDEHTLEGIGTDAKQKVVAKKVINKTPREIEADKPPKPKSVPHEKQMAHITNKQYQNILNRLTTLEDKIK